MGQTSIRITDEQMKLVNKHCLNLSKFVRAKLDEEFDQSGVKHGRGNLAKHDNGGRPDNG